MWRVNTILFISAFSIGFAYSSYYIPQTMGMEPEPLYEEIESEEMVKKDDSVSILFVGDVMLDRGVARHAQSFGYHSLFEGVENLFSSSDIVVINLEGPLTNNTSIAQKDLSILRFTFDPTFAKILKDSGVSAVSLGNNHAFDFGRDGYEQTKRYLTHVGIDFFGTPDNSENLSTRIDIKGKTICLVGYHDLFTTNPDPVIEEIQAIRDECWKIVVLPHWGVEYSTKPNERQKLLAHQFIDVGADMVIGTHPHVVQTLEVYKNKPIFYSLGNFIFDQYFSFETLHGLSVKVLWEDERMNVTLVPISITNMEAKEAQQTESNIILSTLIEGMLSNDISTTIIKNGTFILENK